MTKRTPRPLLLALAALPLAGCVVHTSGVSSVGVPVYARPALPLAVPYALPPPPPAVFRPYYAPPHYGYGHRRCGYALGHGWGGYCPGGW